MRKAGSSLPDLAGFQPDNGPRGPVGRIGAARGGLCANRFPNMGRRFGGVEGEVVARERAWDWRQVAAPLPLPACEVISTKPLHWPAASAKELVPRTASNCDGAHATNRRRQKCVRNRRHVAPARALC